MHIELKASEQLYRVRRATHSARREPYVDQMGVRVKSNPSAKESVEMRYLKRSLNGIGYS